MGKKRDNGVAPQVERTLPDLQSPDDAARGEAVRSLCPCHAGWEAFEEHVADVLRLIRDPSRGVRAQALHVFHDATRMQSESDLAYYREPGQERIGEKRAARYRSMEERLEALKISRDRKRRRR